MKQKFGGEHDTATAATLKKPRIFQYPVCQPKMASGFMIIKRLLHFPTRTFLLGKKKNEGKGQVAKRHVSAE